MSGVSVIVLTVIKVIIENYPEDQVEELVERSALRGREVFRQRARQLGAASTVGGRLLGQRGHVLDDPLGGLVRRRSPAEPVNDFETPVGWN